MIGFILGGVFGSTVTAFVSYLLTDRIFKVVNAHRHMLYRRLLERDTQIKEMKGYISGLEKCNAVLDDLVIKYSQHL